MEKADYHADHADPEGLPVGTETLKLMRSRVSRCTFFVWQETALSYRAGGGRQRTPVILILLWNPEEMPFLRREYGKRSGEETHSLAGTKQFQFMFEVNLYVLCSLAFLWIVIFGNFYHFLIFFSQHYEIKDVMC